MNGLTIAEQEAVDYWADKPWKKFVVTLERGSKVRPEQEVKYVRARGSSQAIACARRNAMTVKNPSRVSCRLATAHDLGCVRIGPAGGV